MKSQFRNFGVKLLVFAVTCVSAAFAANPKDTYLSFSGTTYVYVPHSYHATEGSALTVEFWFNINNTSTDAYFLGHHGAYYGYQWYFMRSASAKRVSFAVRTTGTSYAVVQSAVGWGTDGHWHHVAGVFNGSTIYMYLDGVLAGSAPAPGSFIYYTQTPGYPICLGGNAANSTDGCVGAYGGALDDVRIWNVALSQSSIQSTMNTELTGTESGLTAYWKMDEAQGQILTDSSPSGLNAQLGSTSGVDAYDPVWAFTDTTPPTVVVTSPTEGQTFTGVVDFTANATDNVGVAGVQFQIDGANLGNEITTPPYSIVWDSSLLSNGTHFVTAIARDLANNKTTSEAAPFIASNSGPGDTTPPTVNITAPTNGAAVTGSVTVSATATDNVAVASVQFQVDGLNFGAAETVAPFSTTLDTTKISNGVHTVSAVAADFTGNAATASESISVSNVLRTTPPVLSFIIPTGMNNSARITWNTDELATSQVQWGTDTTYGNMSTADPTMVASHLVTVTGLAQGTTYHFRIYSTDSAGNQAVSNDSTFKTSPLPVACNDPQTFSFVSFSDSPQGLDSGVSYVMQDMWNYDPNIRLLITDGDTNRLEDKRTRIDGGAPGHLNCGEPEFPWFPAMGNHNMDGDETTLPWFTSTYGDTWSTNPAASRLAKQLPGLSNFNAGPSQVLNSTGSLLGIAPATIYSFDYKEAHIIVLNNFEQGMSVYHDYAFGVFDYNGSANNPTNSQLDWVANDLASTTQPVKLVFSHVGLVADWYPNDGTTMDTSGCIEWSEHNPSSPTGPSPFNTSALAAVLSNANVTAIYRGHDHCAARILVDGTNSKVFDRDYLTIWNDPLRPYGDVTKWQGLLGPGRMWQVDTGALLNNQGFYTITRFNSTSITFDTYRFDAINNNTAPGPTVLWDSFTIPLP
jgi:hypothetical protein